MNRKTGILVGAALAAAFLSHGATVESGTRFAHEKLDKYVQSGEFAGAVVAFYEDGLQETTCLGYSDVKTGRKVTYDDPFMMYSQTKGYCGVAVAKLIEEGKLNLDDPISKWFGEFKELWVEVSKTNDVCRLEKAKNVMTLRMVMNHTSGVPFEVPSVYAIGGWNHSMPLRSAAAVAAKMPLKFEPGTKYAYSNLGIDIGAAVVARVSGMPFEKFLEEKFFKPLGMKDTTFRPTEEAVARRMNIYSIKPGRKAEYVSCEGSMTPPYGGPTVVPSAGAGLWTTPRDMMTFFKMLAHCGVGENGVRVLKPETVTNILCKASSPRSGISLGMGAPQPDKETADSWVGFQGALNSRCYFNWHKKRVWMWAVQSCGGDLLPWDYGRRTAQNEFFKYCDKTRAGKGK